MATRRPDVEDMTEPCGTCGRETIHHVRVELRTESTKAENAAYSREPYRVATCVECDRTTVWRMNDA